MSEIRAVFFDIDGTLFSTVDFATRAREASVDAMLEAGLPVNRDELLEELAEVVREFSSNYERHFVISHPEPEKPASMRCSRLAFR